MSLATYTSRITDKIKGWIHPLLHEERPKRSSTSCVLTLSDKTITLLGGNLTTANPEVLFYKNLSETNEDELKLVLGGLIDQYDLANANIIWLLNANDYELNLVESMPVPKNEMLPALSWRVRSLISYPVDEAVLEYFELPPKKNTPNSPFIGAVTARRAKLATTIEHCKTLNLNLSVIDIPELAMLRLSSIYENDEKSTAFIYIIDKIAILNISSQKQLYFTRRLNVSIDQNNEIDFEKLSLEVTRYFDFFRSQWRLPPPTRIFAATAAGDVAPIAKKLSERLINITVQPYQIQNDGITPNIMQDLTTGHLLSYGCLLRKGDGNA